MTDVLIVHCTKMIDMVHEKPLDICNERYLTLRWIVAGVSAVFLAMLATMTYQVIDNFNKLKDADVQIRREQVEYWRNSDDIRTRLVAERKADVADLKEMIYGVRIQLAQFKSALDEHMGKN